MIEDLLIAVGLTAVVMVLIPPLLSIGFVAASKMRATRWYNKWMNYWVEWEIKHRDD